jgi:hypothetical protein
MLRLLVFALPMSMLIGCSWPLKHSTYEVSKSIGKTYTNEVLWNLSQTISDTNAVPSQLLLSSGAVATSQSASASASIPLGDENQIIVTNGGTPGTTSTLLRPFTGLGAQLSGALTESWAVTPVTDPGALSRLRALYRFETSKDSNEQARIHLLYDYVIPAVSVSVSTVAQRATAPCGITNTRTKTTATITSTQTSTLTTTVTPAATLTETSTEKSTTTSADSAAPSKEDSKTTTTTTPAPTTQKTLSGTSTTTTPAPTTTRGTTTATAPDATPNKSVTVTIADVAAEPACDTRTAGTQEWTADPQGGQLPNCVLCMVVVDQITHQLDPLANPGNLRITPDTGCVREASPSSGTDPGWRSVPSGVIPDHDQAILRLNCKLTQWLGWRSLSATNEYYPACANSVVPDTLTPKTTSADGQTDENIYRSLGTFGSVELYMCENAYNAGFLSAFVMHVIAASQVSASASASSGAGGANANSTTSAGNSSYSSALLPSK